MTGPASGAAISSPVASSLSARLTQRNLTDAGLFLANFGTAKVTIYLLPLMIAAFTGSEVYGGIEFSQSIGLLAAALLLGAPLSGITQLHLIRGRQDVFDQVWALNLGACLLSLVAALAGRLLGVAPQIELVLASFGMAASQSTLSNLMRIMGKRSLAAWADGTAMLLAALAAGLALFLGDASSLATITDVYIGFALIGSAVAWVGLMQNRLPGLAGRLRESAAVGLPMVLFSVVSMWLGIGGRITVGLLSASNMAVYGVAFRVAGLSLGIHQLLNTALFARIYKARTRAADRLTAPFLLACLLVTALISLFGGAVIGRFRIASLDDGGMVLLRAILPVVCIQVYFWVGTAMLQVRVNRSGLSRKGVFPIAVLTVGGAAAIFAIVKLAGLGILGLSWLISLHAAGYFAVNWGVLARKGLVHRWIGSIGAAGGAVLALLAIARLLLTAA